MFTNAYFSWQIITKIKKFNSLVVSENLHDHWGYLVLVKNQYFGLGIIVKINLIKLMTLIQFIIS